MRKFLFLLTIICPIIVFIFFPKWTVDDAYIYYRYADNLARHGQLNWNIGQPPVEGYTGVVLPVLLSGFIKLGFSPINVSHVIGMASYWLGLAMLILILRRLKLGTTGQLVGAAFYVFTPILFTHVFSGLETMLFLGLLLTGVYLSLLMVQPGARWRADTLGSLTMLVLSLTRPEGLALSGLLLTAIAIVKFLRDKHDFFWFIARAFLLYALPLVWYFYWRWSYYGQLLPNTFYVKTSVGFSLANIIDLARFLIRYFAAPAMAAFLLVSADVDLLWKKLKNRELLPDRRPLFFVFGAYLVFIVLLLAQFTHSHLNMNYAYRFYLPLLPFLWIVLASAIDGGAKTLSANKTNFPLKHKLVTILALLFAIYQIAFFLAKLKEEVRFAREEQELLSAEHIAIGNFLKTSVPASEWLIVYLDAGAIPYFSGLKTIDLGDLNDRYLARNKPNQDERINYLYAHNPGAIVFTSVNKDSVEYGSEVEAIIKDRRFKNYVLAKKYLSPLPQSMDYKNYHEFLFLRKDLATP